jgi:hypothetical protein
MGGNNPCVKILIGYCVRMLDKLTCIYTQTIIFGFFWMRTTYIEN